MLAIAAFAAAVALGLLVLGPWVMEHVLGSDYAYGRVGLAVIALGMGCHLCAGTLNQAALARGRASAAAASWLAVAAAFVVWMLVPLVDDVLLRAEIGYAGRGAGPVRRAVGPGAARRGARAATAARGRLRTPVLARLWRALGGPAAHAAGLRVSDHGPVLRAPLAVAELVAGAAGAALLAAAELAAARGLPRPVPSLDLDHLAVAAASERHVRLDGAVAGTAFDPTSAFFAAADGWVRTHGNYEHHRAALLRRPGRRRPGAPGVRDRGQDRRGRRGGGRGRRRLRRRGPVGGGVGGTPSGTRCWRARRPRSGSSPARTARPAGRPTRRRRARCPARACASWISRASSPGRSARGCWPRSGADVLRVDPPGRPELPLLALDGGLGKRRATVDLAAPDGAAWLERELARADVVVDGFRPGALARVGLDPGALARRHPRVVHVSLSAWGQAGPWGTRRGFDSLVQAATGVAVAVRPPDGSDPPGALPVQALDHATGYLLAAAALRALTGRVTAGRAGRARLALAATAQALLAAGPREARGPGREPDADPYLTTLRHPAGRLTVVRPPGALDGRPLAWPSAAPAYS